MKEMSPHTGRNQQCRHVFVNSQNNWGKDTKCSSTLDTPEHKRFECSVVAEHYISTVLHYNVHHNTHSAYCTVKWQNRDVMVLQVCCSDTLGLHIVELKKVCDHSVDICFHHVVTQHLHTYTHTQTSINSRHQKVDTPFLKNIFFCPLALRTKAERQKKKWVCSISI